MKTFNLQYRPWKGEYEVRYSKDKVASFGSEKMLKAFLIVLIQDGYTENNSPYIVVTVLKTPVTERYCQVGDTAVLDTKNNQIRCGGAWFRFSDQWEVEEVK